MFAARGEQLAGRRLAVAHRLVAQPARVLHRTPDENGPFRRRIEKARRPRLKSMIEIARAGENQPSVAGTVQRPARGDDRSIRLENPGQRRPFNIGDENACAIVLKRHRIAAARKINRSIFADRISAAKRQDRQKCESKANQPRHCRARMPRVNPRALRVPQRIRPFRKRFIPGNTVDFVEPASNRLRHTPNAG